jgi:hypothetical protein
MSITKQGKHQQLITTSCINATEKNIGALKLLVKIYWMLQTTCLEWSGVWHRILMQVSVGFAGMKRIGTSLENVTVIQALSKYRQAY